MKNSLFKIFWIIVLGMFAFQPTMLTAEVGELVWSVDIQNSLATLKKNQFQSDLEKRFPLRTVLISRSKNLSKNDPKSGRQNLDISLETAAIIVNENGTLGESLTQILSFYKRSHVAEQWNGHEFRILGTSKNQLKSNDALVSYFNITESQGQEILSWIKIPDSNLGMVHTTQATYFFDAGIKEPPGTNPFPYSLYRTYGTVLSVSSKKIATIEKVKNGNNIQQRLIVYGFDKKGQPVPVYQSNLLNGEYDKLYLDPSGKILMFEKKGKNPELGLINIENGDKKILSDVITGFRYYSFDASRMLVIRTGDGLAVYYDITDPYNPSELWNFKVNDNLITAGVCYNGSLVAIQIQNTNTPTKRVVVLDEMMNILSQPDIDSIDSMNMAGIDWEGKYLFVGSQRHPSPPDISRDTKRVDVYDFTGFTREVLK